ncbi:MlaE family ABC transporter permease [Thiohalocapsa marina]|uniref:MlaE family ABC transporter permease n=1 Tax=Thiohalocapsa marina TaxID=424902 RepID=UPI001FEAA744|nr:ABC transporter permease [Thiohalocapsa marina]
MSDGRSGTPWRGPAGWLERLGLAAVTARLCLAHYADVVLGRQQLDLAALAGALRQSGLSILPAITLVTAAAGAILGRQAASIVDEFNLPALLLLSISYAVIMELIPLLVGIMVAGRAGVALAVQQATLVVTGQMDGLLVSGVNPITFTTAPVLLAALLMSFAFAVWGSVVTLGTAFVWLLTVSDLAPSDLADALRLAIDPGDLLEAIVKPLVFALAIVLIATVNGSTGGRDPEGIGQAATRTMVGAVTSILLIDLLFALLW